MLVTRKAPDFIAPAVLPNNQIVDNFELSKNLGKNGAILFFWPKDFTFVCPSEILAMDHRVKEFAEKGFNYPLQDYANVMQKNIQIREETPNSHPLNKIIIW